MKLYRIEKGIKLPPAAHPKVSGKPSAVAATLIVLEKGDSFIVRDPLAALGAGKIMRDFVTRERKRDGTREFASRKAGAGLRIWRIK